MGVGGEQAFAEVFRECVQDWDALKCSYLYSRGLFSHHYFVRCAEHSRGFSVVSRRYYYSDRSLLHSRKLQNETRVGRALCKPKNSSLRKRRPMRHFPFRVA